MATIELLEERVTGLEKLVYGSNKPPLLDDAPSESCVVDSLLRINSTISSALSGCDRANNLVKRLPELNAMLDPNYDCIDPHSDAKLELILATEPEITDYVSSVNRLTELKPLLELDKIGDVPELTPKLNELTVNYLKVFEESEEHTENMWAIFSEYNNIITSIAKSLISMDAAITAAEIAATPKKNLD